MKTLLLFAVPPLVGAVIGFITNVIAIRMLFRPLKEIRFFGHRLPFTPGLLPRQRHKLADSIGAMVERELLTPEIIRARLQREDVKETVKNSISRYTEKVLTSPLEELLDSGSSSSFQNFACSLLRDFAGAPGCGELIRAVSDSLADSFVAGDLRNRTLRELLGPGGGEKMTALAERLIREGISPEEGSVFSELLAGAEAFYPQAVEQLIRFLDRDEIRRKLEEQGRLFLVEIILKLNVVQRFFISTAQYDRTLDERMPEIIGDLVGRLEELLGEEETGRTIIQWARESLDRVFFNGKTVENFVRSLSRIFAAQLDKPLGLFFQNRGAGEIGELIRGFLERLRTRALPEPGAAGEEGSSLFRLLGARIRERYGGESLGALFPLGPEKKEALDSQIRDHILRLAEQQSAAALEAVNVRAMVAERINSLEMIRVERIVLDVMADQLKWIDVFGALLGFLIGLFQSLFSWLLR
jgi:hypothetical protein